MNAVELTTSTKGRLGKLSEQRGNSTGRQGLLQRILFDHTVLVLVLLVVAATVGIFFYLSRLQEQLVSTLAVQGAHLQAKTITELRELYTSDVVEKVRNHGIDVSHDHQGKERTIPLPATLTIELGKRLEELEVEVTVRLYSEYPFSLRKDGGPRDAFERDALRALRQDPAQAFSRIEQYRGQSVIRYAVADRMRAQCIACHNSHPASPKRDWKEGDVRGVLEIIRPISPIMTVARDGLRNMLAATTLAAALALAGLALILGKQRQNARRLADEVAVREQANEKVQSLLREQQSTLESAGIGIAFIKNRRILRCNHMFAQMFGYRVDELIGSSTYRLYRSEEDYLRYGKEGYAAVEAGGSYATDGQHRRQDGSVFWVRTSVTAIDAGDLSKGVIWVVHDIDQRKRDEQALTDSEARFRRLTELSSDWYWEQDENFRFTMVSGGMLRSGSSLPQVMGKTRWELPIEMADADWAPHKAVLAAHGTFSDLEYKIKDGHNRTRWYCVSGEPLFDTAGVFKGYRGVGRDVTQRKCAEALHIGQGMVLEMIATGAPVDEVLARLIHVIESQSEGLIGSILLLDDDNQHVVKSIAPGLPEAYSKALEGLAIGPHVGSCGTAMYLRTRVIVSDIEHDPLWANYRGLAAQHGLRACWSSPILSPDSQAIGSFAMYYLDVREPTAAEIRLADIATRIAGIAIERRRAEERIRHMAHHDALTGLPNRALLGDRVNQAIAQADRRGAKNIVGVLFIDLDHFKHINDSLGHLVGDRLLQMVAQRLQQCVRKGDSLARLGGDEFVITLPGLVGSDAAALVAQKVLDVLDLSFAVEGHELHVGASVGISLYPTNGADAEALMRAADIAMYHAKEKGRGNYQFITSGLNAAVQHRLTLANQLRSALSGDELFLNYQPQVNMESGRIFAVEALLRWRQPERGIISPIEFIPIAEETGLILPIGEWVLREACRQLKRWHEAGHLEIAMAVNLSARQVSQPGFADSVARILEETGVPATALDLEITESLLMQPSDDNLAPLMQLSDMGIQLSVDDFGTGYSSLSYLRRFPIHALKIDQSFVRGIGQNTNDMAIVTAIIAMAQSLNLKVIAEGVETDQQATFLTAHGCVLGQGYYYSRPVEVGACTTLLDKQR